MEHHGTPNEIELIDKLVTRGHLSVAERRALPDGRARGSLVRDAIVKHLIDDGWFPGDWRPNQEYDGGAIERLSTGCRTHWKAEVGAGRFAELGVEEYTDLAKAAEDWVRRVYGEAIDGVSVDWTL